MTSNLPYRAHFRDYLLTANNEKSIVLFCKSLYAFLILKIIFLWPVLREVVVYSPYKFASRWSTIIYAPIKLAQWNLDIFLIGILCLLLVAMIVRVNYLTSALIFWISFCITRLSGSIANGSDAVLNLYLLLTIGNSCWPAFKNTSFRSSQILFSNFVFLLCRIQLALIYLLSGFNKFSSDAWRSGEAIHSIVHLEYFAQPAMTFEFGPGVCVVLAWAVIIFELAFPFLIWVRRFRIPTLILGVCFHVGIIFFLSLPDFGVVMILAYCLFLRSAKPILTD